MTDTETTGMPALLKSKDVAKALGVSEATLSRWRAQGKGPVWINLGMPRYHRADIQAFVESRRR